MGEAVVVTPEDFQTLGQGGEFHELVVGDVEIFELGEACKRGDPLQGFQKGKFDAWNVEGQRVEIFVDGGAQGG